jgi:dCMP deaminase
MPRKKKSEGDRPTTDQYFMKMAYLISERSTCLRRHVGALIVKDKRILTTGYNGAPRGMRHCAEIGCVRAKNNIPPGERHELCRGIHAEQNAIIQAAVFGVSIKEGIMYTTHSPCVVCAKIIINAGIQEIVYADPYIDKLSKEMLKESKIKIRRFEL